MQPYSKHEGKIWKKLEIAFFKYLDFIRDKTKKSWISVCIIAKFIARRNITSTCSQEAPAVEIW